VCALAKKRTPPLPVEWVAAALLAAAVGSATPQYAVVSSGFVYWIENDTTPVIRRVATP
jgi:H+/gluconate symporter-like permease